MLIRVCGVIASTSWVVIRSRTTRSIRDRADPDLVLDQLADGAQPAVAEVVDVVDLVAVLAGVQPDQVLDGRDDVVLGQGAGVDVDVQAELLVGLVAADLGQVVALGVEEQVLQQRLRRLLGRRLARAQLAVDVEQRLVLAGDVVLLQGRQQRLRPGEVLADPVRGPAQGLEQHGDRLPALAVDPDADGRALVDVELQPGTAAGDDLDREDVHVGGLVQAAVEVDARRTDQLGDHDPLGAVDDEGALAGHHREVAHEHRLALDLAGGVVGELRGDEQRGGVGHVLVLALLDGGLDVLESGRGEGQRHGAGEVLDRRDLAEDLLQARRSGRSRRRLGQRCLPLSPGGVADQPVEGFGLQGQQIGNLERLPDLGEGGTNWGAGNAPDHALRFGLTGARDCQDASFRGLGPPLRCWGRAAAGAASDLLRGPVSTGSSRPVRDSRK